jgi:hypothetical protein
MKGKLFYPVVIILLLSIIPFTSVAATVSYGWMNYISFPGNFPTAKNVSGSYYLLEGTSGQTLNVIFQPQSGNGSVTITASSDALAGTASVTEDIEVKYSQFWSSPYYTFALPLSIKSGIDGSYPVNVIAKNDAGAVLSAQSVVINVWSTAHENAAQQISIATGEYSAVSGLITGLYGIAGPSTEVRALLIKAQSEISLAQVAYGTQDWSDAATHAQNAINSIGQVTPTEKATIENILPLYLTWVIYILIIAILLVGVYISILFARKLRRQLAISPKM